MKFIKSFAVFLSLLLLFTACDSDENIYDNIAPTPPRNIYTITGDNQIDIIWDHSPESDVAGYNIYFSFSYNGRYELIGNTPNDYFIDYDAVNGETYYYAVTAYDFNGNESELSYDLVYDTPRPEGLNQTVYDYLDFPNTSGYDFSEYSILPYDDIGTDFFFENFEGTYYLNVWEDSDIIDMGVTNDIYEITEAPNSGWVPLVDGENVKYTEAFAGHTYIIWTWDNHFAKIRIHRITPERMVFDWIYQMVEGSGDLRKVMQSKERVDFSREVIKIR